MRSYQSILILRPDLDEAQVDQALEKVTGFLAKYEGACLKVEKWGKKRLAYRVKKSRFGYYLNIYHTCECSGVASLEKDFKLYDLILKYLVIRLDEKELTRAMDREFEAETEEKNDKSPDKKAEAKKAEAKEDDAKEDDAPEKSAEVKEVAKELDPIE
ncbi:MAG TPA: 30S ribosomal protein S6 [Nitrospinaceae bacterium]|nr:30S ribosomal protein S6 [Nitrospinaceae bacterium]HJO58611.1 30S ribosomal protein S6 [Nitrospinaceae bacterium]